VQIFASVQGALIPGRLISDPARHRYGRGRAATFFGAPSFCWRGLAPSHLRLDRLGRTGNQLGR
jgi:hypothetical protein